MNERPGDRPRAGSRASLDILMYHSIGTARKPLGVSRDTFRMQLDVLAECGFQGVSLGNAFASRTVEVGSRHLALTFDDGYKDFVEIVAPELATRGWTA